MLETLRGFGSGLFVREQAAQPAVGRGARTLRFLQPGERRSLEGYLAAGNMLAL
jgi:hypothetical protein